MLNTQLLNRLDYKDNNLVLCQMNEVNGEYSVFCVRNISVVKVVSKQNNEF